MPVLRITQVDKDPILRQKAREVQPEEFGSPELARLVEDMIETMVSAKGVGIAAPQVGVGWRIFAMETADGPAVLVNPVIVPRSKKTTVDVEGCLSCPGKEVRVERLKEIDVSAKNLNGDSLKFTVKDWLARVVQHEVDHLDGILIVDK